MVSFSLQALMLRNQMAMVASRSIVRDLQMHCRLQLLDRETISAMTGFIPDLHREKKQTRGKCKGPRQPPTCVYCRDSPDPEVRNSEKNVREDGQEVDVKGNEWIQK
ncbi:hypothetical protein IV203_028672 [Nitzschia inconspicua]|uniref:Uncharacterized protein n=1 Tax=Nitzschia inconspicua TaxID=303405 RepID=A0A9K3LQ13_9STRA|nr:hypothetical protein IV203_028672 [Nitzschia inconspicua]